MLVAQPVAQPVAGALENNGVLPGRLSGLLGEGLGSKSKYSAKSNTLNRPTPKLARNILN